MRELLEELDDLRRRIFDTAPAPLGLRDWRVGQLQTYIDVGVK